jgi:ABC-2 type transport system ATP-binding protein
MSVDRSGTEETTMTMSKPGEWAIETRGLVKAFGGTRAVDGVDLTVPVGGVYGLLGPNGAGKTTTIRTLATLLAPDGGEAFVFGHNVVREAPTVRARIGLTGQFASIDEDLTGIENLVLQARLWGLARKEARRHVDRLLETFDLVEAAARPVKTYSGGMRRRLDIASSLVVQPDLLFLDEPTTGLDPRSRNQVWEIVRTMVGQGATILLTTQYLDEADQLADRIAVIDHGRVVAEGTPGQLKAAAGSGVLQLRLQDPDRRSEACRLVAGVMGATAQVEAEPAVLSARVDDPGRAMLLLAELSRAGIHTVAFALAQPSLDDVFLALTAPDAETTEIHS